jgi:hypothetical protein
MSRISIKSDVIPKKGLIPFFTINDIQLDELVKDFKSYNFTTKNRESSINITFLNQALDLIEDQTVLKYKNKTLKQSPISFRKLKKGGFDFSFEIIPEKVKKHDYSKSPFVIRFENSSFKVIIMFKLSYAQKNALFNSPNISSTLRGRNALVVVKSKTKLDRFDLEPVNKEMKTREIKEQLDNELDRFGIYLTHPNSFKRCFNCANYTDKVCASFYRVEVSSNHTCRKFYSYKTYLGGGFSSK